MPLPRLHLRRFPSTFAHPIPRLSLRQQSAGISSPDSCRALIAALRAIDIKRAEAELSSARRVSAGLTATGIGLILIWVILCVIRFRVLRRRFSRLFVDVTSALLAAGAAVLFAISAAMSSNLRDYNFYKAPLAALEANTNENTARKMTAFFRDIPTTFPSACIDTHGGTMLGYKPAEVPRFKKAMEVIASSSPKYNSVIHIVAISLSIVAAGMILASVVSAVLAMCVKAAPEEEGERTWTAPPRVSRQAPAPSYQFFQRFLEPVTAPPEGVFGARENGDCRICLEVLMDDMSRLTACSHTFHTKCVVQWLVEADKPCCPLCKEPVRLVQR